VTAIADRTPRRRRGFFGLVTANLVSEIGTAMSGVAIPWLVLVTTGSAARTGVIGFAEMAPYVIMQATAGPLADRLGFRRMYVVGNSIAAAVVCLIPILHSVGDLPFGVLATLVAVGGAVRGAADSSINPQVPLLADLAGMPIERAAGLASTAYRVGMLVGIPSAGLLIAATSPAGVVLIDGLSFAVAAAMVASFVPPLGAQHPDGRPAFSLRGYAAELAEGMRFLRGDRLLLGIVAMVVVSNFLDQGLDAVLIPVWVRERINEPAALGVIGGVAGAALVLGVLLGSWLGPRLPRRAVYAVGYLVGGSPGFFALAAWRTLPPVLVVTACCGLFAGGLNPILGAVQFERVPKQLQARVLGAVKASAWAGVPFGALLAGGLVQSVGLGPTLVSFGAVMFVLTLAPFVFPAWKQMNRSPVPAEPEPDSAISLSPDSADPASLDPVTPSTG
jgi:MFS family permease